MATKISEFWKQIKEFFSKLDKKKKIILGGITAFILFFCIILTVMLNKTNYVVLYTGLDAAEAGELMEILDGMGVSAKAQGTGTILVPQTGADSLRMDLAAKGYPQSGLNYDIFSGSTGFSTTDLEKRTLAQYQLQENLRSTISSAEKIDDCIVIVNLATQSSYVLSSNSSQASASVVLRLAKGQELSRSEALSIGELLRTSVPNIQLENIRVMDSKLRLYDLNSQEDSEYSSGDQYELREKMRLALEKQATAVLLPSFGSDNFAVTVNLSLNFDKEVQNIVEFSPPVYGETEGILRSKDEEYSGTRLDVPDVAGGQPGTDNNLVSAPDYVYSGEALDENQISESMSRVYNYEINEYQTQLQKAQGRIEDLSMAVVISDEGGNAAYGESVTNLLAKAIGVDERYISVEFMPFTQSGGFDFGAQMEGYEQSLRLLTRKSLIRTAIITLAALIFALTLLRFFRSSPEPETAYVVDEEGNFVDMSVGDDPENTAGNGDLAELSYEKPDKVRQIESLLNKNPEVVAQTLRNWLSEDF